MACDHWSQARTEMATDSVGQQGSVTLGHWCNNSSGLQISQYEVHRDHGAPGPLSKGPWHPMIAAAPVSKVVPGFPRGAWGHPARTHFPKEPNPIAHQKRGWSRMSPSRTCPRAVSTKPRGLLDGTVVVRGLVNKPRDPVTNHLARYSN